MTDAIKALLLESHIKITDFQKSKEAILSLCNTLADWIFAALQGKNKNFPQYLITDHLLTKEARPEIITFSGGVAECMGKALPDFAFGDIGVLLGKAVLKKAESQKIQVAKTSCDPIRATVIGASHFSTRLSGSTISYFNIDLPIKNLPCVCLLSQIGDTPCAFCPQREKNAFLSGSQPNGGGHCSSVARLNKKSYSACRDYERGLFQSARAVYPTSAAHGLSAFVCGLRFVQAGRLYRHRRACSGWQSGTRYRENADFRRLKDETEHQTFFKKL